MKPLQHSPTPPLSTTLEQVLGCLAFPDYQQVLELGCGRGETIRQLAARYPQVRFLASDVDRQAWQWNLQQPTPPNLQFHLAGAQQIDLADGSLQGVLMIKSLHHVPVADMLPCLREIHRVLVAGGLACLIEPVYAGPFNEVLRLFHDEQEVRKRAAAAIEGVIEEQRFRRVRQVMYHVRRHFRNFDDYENQVMQVSHSDFQIDAAKRAAVQARFMQYADADGSTTFLTPHRLDLLQSR